MSRLMTNWNDALTALSAAVTPDTQRPLVPYGQAFTASDLGVIPQADLPSGLPAWMRSDEPWATRQGATPKENRATITVQIPEGRRPF
jgi:hypothetical protein